MINNGAHSKQMMTMENASVAEKRQLLRLKRTIKTFEKQFEKEHGRQSTEVSYVRRSRRIEVFTYTVPYMHVHPCVCVGEGGRSGSKKPVGVAYTVTGTLHIMCTCMPLPFAPLLSRRMSSPCAGGPHGRD